MVNGYIRYNPNPVPESHMGMWNRWVGVRSALRHRLEERTRAIESRERMYPQTSEYDLFHLDARLVARRFEAAVASFPRRPSMEKTRGVKVRRLILVNTEHATQNRYKYMRD